MRKAQKQIRELTDVEFLAYLKKLRISQNIDRAKPAIILELIIATTKKAIRPQSPKQMKKKKNLLLPIKKEKANLRLPLQNFTSRLPLS